jgi:DNA-binding MarR family transcriptional regulator/ribosomal protein S18 acetylase RimI-like enzyme
MAAVDPVQTVRRFNRFYTRQIGLLEEKLLASELSLAELRMLYELAHRRTPTASELAHELLLDAGYTSRILAGFERRGLLRRRRSAGDARRNLLALTPRGRRVFAPLDARSSNQVAALLAGLSAADRDRLLAAMATIERLLAPPPPTAAPYLVRPHRSGDLGWVIERHAALYADEQGWGETFEALVAQVGADFLAHHDPRRERCWIAERNEQRVGSVFLVAHSRTVAKLRLLLVEPEARGLGIGRRLVAECVAFGRQAGYRRLTLWTQSNLLAARHLYQEAGFRRVASEPHTRFGHGLVGETWELPLRSPAPPSPRR